MTAKKDKDKVEVVKDDGGPDTEEIVLPTEIADGALYNVGPVPPELAYLYEPETPPEKG